MSDAISILTLIATIIIAGANFFFTQYVHGQAKDRENQLDMRAKRLEEESRVREQKIDERELRIEKSTAYLRLELASIDVFKYKAAHWEALQWAEHGKKHSDRPEAHLEEEADQFFYQCLNLFEICSRFRNEGIIEPSIYGSWVAWFYEVLESRFFRWKWYEEYCDNYTDELRSIFNFGIDEIDWTDSDDRARRERFYKGVGAIVDCPIIKNWKIDQGGSKLSRLRSGQNDKGGESEPD